MNNHEQPSFIELLTGMAAVHNKNLSKAVIDIYWQALARFTLADVKHALQTHVNHPDGGQFFPKPADIIRLLEGSGSDKASTAWAKVEKAIARIGSYSSVVFDDSLIHAVIEDMGGWIKLCEKTAEKLSFNGLEFQKRYQGFLTTPPKRHPKVLKGRVEADNARNGHKVPPPIFVGDKIKARKVQAGGGGRSLEIHEHRPQQGNVITLNHYVPKEEQS